MSARMKLVTPGHVATLFLVALLLLIAPHLFGQVDSTATGGNGGNVAFVISGVIAILVPAAATYALSGLKKGMTFIDDLSPVLQQLLAFLLGFGIAKLAALLNVVLPTDLHLWTGDTIASVLTGLAALGVHAIRKGK